MIYDEIEPPSFNALAAGRNYGPAIPISVFHSVYMAAGWANIQPMARYRLPQGKDRGAAEFM